MKAVKILLKVIVVIVLLVVVAFLALPLWFGPVVKTAANAVVPDIVKTDFNLGHLHLNPYTARFELGDMQLSNPAGYSEKYAATLGDIIFDAEALSLASDTIHIEEITVKNVFVSLVSGGENKVDNFKQIQYNIAGGKEKYEAAEAEKAKAAEEEKIRLDGLKDQASAKDEKPAEKAEEKPSKKVVIDKLHISGLKVKYGFVPISVPVTIELSDIGKDSGGATFEEAWQQIWAGILKAAGVTGEQLKALGNLTGDAARQATAAATKAASQATAAMGSAAEGAGKMASQATDALGDAAKGATDALGGAAKGASDATKKVGDAAGKALDSIKNLW